MSMLKLINLTGITSVYHQIEQAAEIYFPGDDNAVDRNLMLTEIENILANYLMRPYGDDESSDLLHRICLDILIFRAIDHNLTELQQADEYYTKELSEVSRLLDNAKAAKHKQSVNYLEHCSLILSGQIKYIQSQTNSKKTDSE